jgi:hypothetical protein
MDLPSPSGRGSREATGEAPNPIRESLIRRFALPFSRREKGSVHFDISDFGFEVSYRPFSKFFYVVHPSIFRVVSQVESDPGLTRGSRLESGRSSTIGSEEYGGQAWQARTVQEEVRVKG